MVVRQSSNSGQLALQILSRENVIALVRTTDIADYEFMKKKRKHKSKGNHKMGCDLAISGVAGAVGQEVLAILEQRDFPFDSVKMFASSRSAGKMIEFKGNDSFSYESIRSRRFPKRKVFHQIHRRKFINY